MLDFRNINTLWASVLVETLVRSGLTTAVIAPGSRSTPLTVTLATHPKIDTVPILDERSASFFALGHAKASNRATLLVCTSGTAGANYFPAIIEAYESQVPLLVLTADRPPELRDCTSGQTIDQQKLFGRYVRSYAELALPKADLKQLRYLRQVVAQFWQQCHTSVAGPVHLNCPFRDPLAPIVDNHAHKLANAIDEQFFRHIAPYPSLGNTSLVSEKAHDIEPPHTTHQSGTLHQSGTFAEIAYPLTNLPSALGQTERGIIIAGPAQPQCPQAYCQAIATLSATLGWPVLADGLSPLRNWASLNPHLVTTYDSLLRHTHHAEPLIPEQVIQLGALPTSKVLRQWLEQTDPTRWIVTQAGRNQDPLHGAAVHLPLSLVDLVTALQSVQRSPTAYCKAWCEQAAIARQKLANQMQSHTDLFESKLSWLLPTLLPPETPLMIANSMPVRDVEWFWPLNNQKIQPYFSRGANGIDGTLSTAMGIAHHHRRAVLLTGDLALLHDSNGFLNANQRDFHLTILLINNQGGGIFEMLPISQFDPPFETFFATPQTVDFGTLAAAHHIAHQCIRTWEELETTLSHMPSSGVRLLEMISDRKRDTQRRMALLEEMGSGGVGE
ncbi:MAG: 2-succinyl-5-enolpyruvyl-6-hydroxy-3-cyclohexene-1-carboxylic-acid synthase [Cyanobacteria bacterium J06626_18]